MHAFLLETVSLPLSDSPSEANHDPAIRAEPLHHEVRLRRRLSQSPSGRTWWLDVAIFVPLIDPEQVLQESEGFLVDSSDNRPVGVVDSVVTDEQTGFVSALEVAGGQFVHGRFRVAAEEIELVVPASERILLRLPADRLPEPERPLA